MTQPRVKVCLVVAVVALAGCADPSTRYTGTLTTQQGACGTGFGPDGTSAATLVVRGADVQFAPSDGVTVLTGHASDKGHVVAESVTSGADHKPFQQVFEGDRDGDRVAGRFASPRCRASVVLTRK